MNAMLDEPHPSRSGRLGWPVWALFSVCLAWIALPTLYGYRNTPDGMTFSGVVENPVDGAHSVMWMEEARAFTGFLVPILHNSDDRDPAYFNLLWNGLGELSALTGLSTQSMYHLSHLAGVLVFFWLSWMLCTQLFQRRHLRWTAFLVVQLGCGLGWLQGVLKDLPAHYPHGAPDVWAPEMTVFGSLMTFPHFAVSLALLLAGHMSLLASQREAERARIWLPCVLFASLGFVHVYDLIPAGAAWGLWLLISRARDPDETQTTQEPIRWSALVLTALGAALPLGFYLYLTRSSAAMANWNATNQMPSPALGQYLVALGIPGVLCLLFIIRNAKIWRKDPLLRLLVCWFLVTFPLLYSAPLFPFERRFMEGWWIPTALLAVCALDKNRSRDANKLKGGAAFAVALVCLSLPGTVHKSALAVDRLQRPKAPFYRSDGWHDLCRHIQRNTDPAQTTILTTHETGLYLSTCALRFVYIGHPQLTPDHGRRAYEATHFMSGSMANDALVPFLLSNKITHIVRAKDADEQLFKTLQDQGAIIPEYESGAYALYRVLGH